MIRHYIRLYIILYYTIAGAGRPADGHHYYRPPRHHSSAWVPGWRRRPFLRFPRCSRLLSPHAHTFRYFSLFIYLFIIFFVFCYLAAPSAADIYKTHSLTWKSASGIIIYLCSTKKEKGTYILGTECRKNRRKKSVRSSVFFFFFLLGRTSLRYSFSVQRVRWLNSPGYNNNNNLLLLLLWVFLFLRSFAAARFLLLLLREKRCWRSVCPAVTSSLFLWSWRIRCGYPPKPRKGTHIIYKKNKEEEEEEEEEAIWNVCELLCSDGKKKKKIRWVPLNYYYYFFFCSKKKKTHKCLWLICRAVSSPLFLVLSAIEYYAQHSMTHNA